MSKKSIRELMVPLSDYATVSQETSLFEAVAGAERGPSRIYAKQVQASSHFDF